MLETKDRITDNEWDTSSGNHKLNEHDFSNPHLIIDVGKNKIDGTDYYGDDTLMVRTTDGDIIKDVPKAIKGIAGNTYKTYEPQGHRRKWNFTPDAIQDIEYYLKNLARKDNYRLIRYEIKKNPKMGEGKWLIEVEKEKKGR